MFSQCVDSLRASQHSACEHILRQPCRKSFSGSLCRRSLVAGRQDLCQPSGTQFPAESARLRSAMMRQDGPRCPGCPQIEQIRARLGIDFDFKIPGLPELSRAGLVVHVGLDASSSESLFSIQSRSCSRSSYWQCKGEKCGMLHTRLQLPALAPQNSACICSFCAALRRMPVPHRPY